MVEQPAKPVDNGQAEPQAAVISFSIWKLKELTEDTLPVVLGNAGTAIPYFDAQHFAAPTTSDNDSAAQCVAHGIGYQVEQYPFEQQGVAPHPSIRSNNA